MEIIWLLIPLSILFVAAVAVVLVWAIRSGQYDDLERGRTEVLLDDDSIEGSERDRDQ